MGLSLLGTPVLVQTSPPVVLPLTSPAYDSCAHSPPSLRRSLSLLSHGSHSHPLVCALCKTHMESWRLFLLSDSSLDPSRLLIDLIPHSPLCVSPCVSAVVTHPTSLPSNKRRSPRLCPSPYSRSPLVPSSTHPTRPSTLRGGPHPTVPESRPFPPRSSPGAPLHPRGRGVYPSAKVPTNDQGSRDRRGSVFDPRGRGGVVTSMDGFRLPSVRTRMGRDPRPKKVVKESPSE